MKRKQAYELLKEAQDDREPVCLRSASAPAEKCEGYVVGLTKAYVLLHYFTENPFCLNGYDVFPLRDLASVVTIETRHSNIIGRGLRVKGMIPVAPQNVDLDNGPAALLSSIDAHFPLTVVYTEGKRPDRCFIGRVAKLGNKSMRLREIDPDARWNRTRKYRYKDITRIGFGSGYEETLWLVSLAERERTGRSIENDKKKK